MRYALALFALAMPLFAQDTDGPGGEPDKPFDAAQADRKKETAASLFYRAFWIEQARRKGEEAEKLYAEVIEKYADAPEAPRAIVALIRLRAARGVEVADLVRQLEEGYPKLVKEIERARKLAARLRSDFDPTIQRGDTPVMLKLKGIYGDLAKGSQIRSEDRDFLSDIGAAGHPMLARVLRSSTSSAVRDGNVASGAPAHERGEHGRQCGASGSHDPVPHDDHRSASAGARLRPGSDEDPARDLAAGVAQLAAAHRLDVGGRHLESFAVDRAVLRVSCDGGGRRGRGGPQGRHEPVGRNDP